MPTSTVDDVVITGQRRIANSTVPFPGKDGSSGIQQNEDTVPGGDEGGGQVIVPSQCSAPQAKRVWNADAAAAAAISDFLARASTLGDGFTLRNREFGAALTLGPNDSVNLSTITWGDPAHPGVTPAVTIDTTGVTNQNWMGDVHNHPSGNPLPSVGPSGDWPSFMGNISQLELGGRSTDGIAMYVIVQDEAGNIKTYAYTKDSNPNEIGKEVNPDAAPCPS